MTGARIRGFVYEDGDPSVGIFGGAWVHEDCPSSVPHLDGPGLDVIGQMLAVVRKDELTIRTWSVLTCTDCAQQTLVYDDDFSPSDAAVEEQERAEREQLQIEAYADAALAAFDDDPNPYHGDYSEA